MFTAISAKHGQHIWRNIWLGFYFHFPGENFVLLPDYIVNSYELSLFGSDRTLEEAVGEVNRVKSMVACKEIDEDQARDEINLFHGVTVYCLERR